METRYFKTLVTVVEMGSFSKAAKSLHVTQSAISQRIKFLEEAFGHLLFDRGGVVLKLTAVGEIVLGSARQILDAEEVLASRLSRISARNKVSFCCTPTFGAIYLPKVLSHFMADKDSSPIDLSFLFHNSDQALLGIKNKEFDISVIEHCPEANLARFRTYELPADELVFVSSPKLNFSSSNCTIDDLFQFSLFVREDGCSSRQLLVTGLTAHGYGLNNFTAVATSDDLRLTCQMVLEGSGVSFISSRFLRNLVLSCARVVHLVADFPLSRQRKIVIEKGREGEEMIECMVSCIYNVLGVPVPV